MCYLKSQIYWDSLTVTTMVSLYSAQTPMHLFLHCALFLSEVFSQKKKKNFSILFVLAEPFRREEGQKTPCPVELCFASWANAIKEILLKLEEFLKNHAGNLIRAKDPWGLEGHIFSHSNFTPLQILLKNKTIVALKYSRKKNVWLCEKKKTDETGLVKCW